MGLAANALAIPVAAALGQVFRCVVLRMYKCLCFVFAYRRRLMEWNLKIHSSVGLQSNPLPTPHTDQKNRDLNDAEPLQEVAAAAREQYQARERGYQEAVGRLAAKRTQVCIDVDVGGGGR